MRNGLNPTRKQEQLAQNYIKPTFLGLRVQTQNNVGFMTMLIYHMKQMECGVVGNVSSRVLELS
jgi:hypothetical protein